MTTTDETADSAPPQVHYQNTLDDWRELRKAFFAQQRWTVRFASVLSIVAFVVACCLPAALLLLAIGQFEALSVGLVSAAGFGLFVLRLIRRSTLPDSRILRPTTIILHPEFLEAVSDTSWERRDWAMIERVQATDTLLAIQRDDGLIYAIPRRAFPSPEAAAAFLETAQRLFQQGKDRGRPTVAASWQAPAAHAPVSAADSIQVTYTTSAQEFASLQTGEPVHPVNKQSNETSPKTVSLFPLILLAVLAGLSLTQLQISGNGLAASLTAFVAFVVLSMAMAFPMIRLLKFIAARRTAPTVAVTQTVTISPTGVALWSPGLEKHNAWETIDGVQESDQLVIFSANRPMIVYLYIIPKSAFPNEFEARRFAETAARYQQAAIDRREEQELVASPHVETGNPYQPPQTK